MPRELARTGFTIIEMIGVLAVVAILATIIISATPRQMDIVAGSLETTNLVNCANALQNSILRNRYIPGTNDVVSVIAAELGMDIKDVSTNSRNNRRAFIYQPYSASYFAFYTNKDLIDPGHLVRGVQGWQQSIGGAFNFPPGGTPVYGGGSNMPPVFPRIMIVSSLATTLPSAVLGGMTGPNQDSDFQHLWDAVNDVALSQVTAFNGWGGAFDDLRIQRIDLSPLFVHLILYNYNNPAPGLGQYTIDPDRPGATILQVTNGQYGVDSYFLRGTVLGLLKATGNNSTVDSYQILNRDTSFAYTLDVWRSSINLGEGVDPTAAIFGTALWAVAEAFQASPYNSLAATNFGQRVTPPVVVTNMLTFMSNYINYANAGFPGDSRSNLAKASQNMMISNMFGLLGSGDWTPNNSGVSIKMVLKTNACY